MEHQQPPMASGTKAISGTTVPFGLARDHTSTSPPVVPPVPSPAPPASDPSKQSGHGSIGSPEAIKAKIMSHPLYPSLLRAIVECRKIGAPLDVARRLSSITDELTSDHRPAEQEEGDPELDQFMETYFYMMARYVQELGTPIQEADKFLRSMEAQFDSLALDDNSCEGDDYSSEDEQEAAGGMAAAGGSPENAAGNAELKSHLLNKYNGYLSSLWRELSKKKKKGHLPRDARGKLLQWWHLHYRWPYPSEMEKAVLAESTGLDMKQISNWFINQRKRHWKPFPMAPAPPVMDYYRSSLHPQHGGSTSSSPSAAALCKEGGSCQHFFTGGGCGP
ncbi:hypothetical protein GUJ93_ZPchr0013g34376 [Zizania palustris]|uniref:Uncharacterized protein n=1 Tax=Zizania palustris TaxID=103762 RepID=A0A8J5WVA5_ZIZPA|nr:hypothetical protein GUJ93_ZPchr0013g34376 [Zizania palustris]